ncbi:MAG: tRNA lysidine(34) synthetase TilS [Ilumatobacteraceae bacterium]
MSKNSELPLHSFLPRCTFPPPGTTAHCAFSGGPDSTALIALAAAHGCDVVAHHVDHGIRPSSAAEARRARDIAGRLDIAFQLHSLRIEPGPNLEARARSGRRKVLPDPHLTGHTADDQAETVLIRLLRGSGTTGLAAIEPGEGHPVLGLRRTETLAICAGLGIQPVHDASNELDDAWRNRIRHELLPLMADIADRDPVPILARTAELLRDDDAHLDALATIDPTDALAVAAAPPVLARRALRRWLTDGGYPPDAAAIERVMAMARGESRACELPGGRRVERSHQRFRIVGGDR